MRGLFVTGTGTEVGKTVVTAGILRFLRRNGVDAISMKPVQTGAIPKESGFEAPDLVFHQKAAGLELDAETKALCAPYLYEPACSPHLAAEMANRPINIAEIVQCGTKLAAKHSYVLCEGAGGVVVPLNESQTMVDLMVALEFPVLLVAHRGLGTINHTLMSIETLRNAGLTVFGVIFNEVEDVEPDFIKHDNPKTVERFGRVDILGDVSYLAGLDADPDRAWTRFEAEVPGLSKILREA